MQILLFKDEYPIFTMTLAKEKSTFTNVPEILDALQAKVDAHPVATYIGLFDHYAHTSSLESGEIVPDIIDAKNILFCFGKEIPSAEMLAVRPRSIGIAERQDDFVISFLKAPNPAANEAMMTWVKSLQDR